jgi:hypothetical protein
VTGVRRYDQSHDVDQNWEVRPDIGVGIYDRSHIFQPESCLLKGGHMTGVMTFDRSRPYDRSRAYDRSRDIPAL